MRAAPSFSHINTEGQNGYSGIGDTTEVWWPTIRLCISDGLTLTPIPWVQFFSPFALIITTCAVGWDNRFLPSLQLSPLFPFVCLFSSPPSPPFPYRLSVSMRTHTQTHTQTHAHTHTQRNVHIYIQSDKEHHDKHCVHQ